MKPGELEQLLFTTLIGTGVIALLAYPWIKRSYSGVQRVVRRFLGINPSNLPVVTKQMSHFELPNIEVAIRTISHKGSVPKKTIGYTSDIGDKKLYERFYQPLPSARRKLLLFNIAVFKPDLVNLFPPSRTAFISLNLKAKRSLSMFGPMTSSADP